MDYSYPTRPPLLHESNLQHYPGKPVAEVKTQREIKLFHSIKNTLQ
jgi:hypothetical protein